MFDINVDFSPYPRSALFENKISRVKIFNYEKIICDYTPFIRSKAIKKITRISKE